jgi:hypothetical protein
MEFIEKTTFSANYDKMYQDMTDFINNAGGWPVPQTLNNKKYPANQIGLKHRLNCDFPLIDAGGNLYDEVNQRFHSTESDFTEWVSIVPEYTKNIIQQLEQTENVKFGRIRYMRLQSKLGLSVHKDFEPRYHYVFDTNSNAFFGERLEGNITAQCYHIPNDSYFYKIDTTRDHFVFNGGWTDRIHLVLNVING